MSVGKGGFKQSGSKRGLVSLRLISTMAENTVDTTLSCSQPQAPKPQTQSAINAHDGLDIVLYPTAAAAVLLTVLGCRLTY